jgi:hypothetical protein
MVVFFAYLTGIVKDLAPGQQKISDDMYFRPLDASHTIYE